MPGSHRHKITPIANLLGRHGSHHMLLGMLIVLPTGGLAVADPTASIALDVSQAVAVPDPDAAWFVPGMIVLADGVYEEEDESGAAGRGLGGSTGVGGTLGGRFQAFFIGQPPAERRRATLGVTGPEGAAAGADDHASTIGGGFGWIDFLGVGSERAAGPRMRRLEARLLRQQRRPHFSVPPSLLPAGDDAPDDPGSMAPERARIVLIGECALDQPRTLEALRKILATYAAAPPGRTPMAFVLAGNFVSHAVMARGGGGGGSIEYKEYFDALALALADFPTLLASATFYFLPGDNDGWVSAFGAGAAVPLPRAEVPAVFTSRVRRAFATANAEAGPDSGTEGEAVWTTNPSRVSVFGPSHEIVLFRDDIAARLRRNAVRLKMSEEKHETLADDTTMSGAQPEPATQASDVMDLDDHPSSPTDPSAAATKEGATGVSNDVRTARKLVKTLLDQGYLAPFRQQVRPVHWDHAAALHLYPLPTAVALVDPTAPPFCITYEGCHVMNPGAVLVPGRRGLARWVEYDLGSVGRLRECLF